MSKIQTGDEVEFLNTQKNLRTVAVFIVCFSTMLTSCLTETNSPDSNIVVPSPTNVLDSLCTPISKIEAAYANHDTDISVTVKGRVTRILSDDTVGDKHQRFIIQLSNQQTLLIEHNINIAPRVAGIMVGNDVYIHGDYVWNDQGGLIHWTHHDPAGVHENGWIVLGDKKYQ
jgi:hypothetical protein